jgi:hypothetical protein
MYGGSDARRWQRRLFVEGPVPLRPSLYARPSTPVPLRPSLYARPSSTSLSKGPSRAALGNTGPAPPPHTAASYAPGPGTPARSAPEGGRWASSGNEKATARPPAAAYVPGPGNLPAPPIISSTDALRMTPVHSLRTAPRI